MTQSPTPPPIQIELPAHLRQLAGTRHTVSLPVPPPITQRTLLNALELQYPALRGTVRDQVTLLRRPFIRFFACNQDLSHLDPDDLLPDPVARGIEPFLIIGAIAGG